MIATVSCTPARRAAVHTFVTGTRANHDRPARRARRSVFLVLDCRKLARAVLAPVEPGTRHRTWRRCAARWRRWLQRAAIVVFGLLPQVHAGAILRFRRQELRRHPPEDVV